MLELRVLKEAFVFNIRGCITLLTPKGRRVRISLKTWEVSGIFTDITTLNVFPKSGLNVVVVASC